MLPSWAVAEQQGDVLQPDTVGHMWSFCVADLASAVLFLRYKISAALQENMV